MISGHVAEPLGDDPQQLVAGVVTKPVVHRLEAVEIEKQQYRIGFGCDRSAHVA